jgi:hypothetical protein
MKPRSAGHLHVEAVEKPLFKPQSFREWREFLRAILISVIGFPSRRIASADSFKSPGR